MTKLLFLSISCLHSRHEWRGILLFSVWFGFRDPFPRLLACWDRASCCPLLSLSPSWDQFLLFPLQFLLKGTSPVWQLENAPLFCFASLWGIPSFREHKYLAVSGITHSPWFLWEITEQLKIYFYVISVKHNILMGCTKKIYILKPSRKSNIILNVVVWSLI